MCRNTINTEFEKRPESDEETQNGMDSIFRIWDDDKNIPDQKHTLINHAKHKAFKLMCQV